MNVNVRARAVVLSRVNEIAAANARNQRMIGKYGGFE